MIKYKKIFHDIYLIAQKAGKTIWSFLSLSLADNIFSVARVVCISIEADGVYLVYGEKALRRPVIRHCKYFPLEDKKPLSPEYVATAVSAFVTEFKILKASFVLCVPRAWAIVQNVEFPLAAKENLSMVISFELDRLTPLTQDNAYYDYSVLGEDEQNISILLTVAKADKINAYMEAIQSRHIEVKNIVISSYMIKSLIKDTYPKMDAVFMSLKGETYECGAIRDSLLIRILSKGGICIAHF